ncbi:MULTISPECIES: uroporphyrinogen-III synthase [unclassified Psychrobacter]|uniref:uroporphyrinogen-III synthase n=1 Tax=unclassified Psychrobacter TaxID=196806 RepID=UPI003FD3DBE4
MSSDLDQLSAALSSNIVINTRPVERAAPLTHLLQSAGLTVVDMPMLALQPRAITEQEVQVMKRWMAGDYQALVIVSPTAAASGLGVWQKLEQKGQEQTGSDSLALQAQSPDVFVPNKANNEAPSHIIAVGTATAAVLQSDERPINYQVLQPMVANNEGMLAMPEIESLQKGDKLLVWRGLGGRRLLVDTLQARGVHIDSIAWYERVMPVDAQQSYQRWREQTTFTTSKPIVLISSGSAFEHWTSIVTQGRAAPCKSLVTKKFGLNDFTYIVLGERLANMLDDAKLDYWRVEDLAPETILSTIKSNLCAFKDA